MTPTTKSTESHDNPENMSGQLAGIWEQLSAVTRDINDISSKADDIVSRLDDISDLLSNSHGNHYGSDADFMVDPDDE